MAKKSLSDISNELILAYKNAHEAIATIHELLLRTDGTNSVDTEIKTEDTEIKTEDTEIKTEDTEIKTEDTEIKTEDTEIKTEDTEIKTEDTEIKTEDTEIKTEDTEIKTEDTEIKTEDTEIKTEANCSATEQRAADIRSDLNNRITLHVIPSNKKFPEVLFRMWPDAKFNSLITMYTKRLKLEKENFRFFFNGYIIADSDTPESLEMVNGNVIEVYEEQCVCGDQIMMSE